MTMELAAPMRKRMPVATLTDPKILGPAVIDALKKLDIELVLPGHGDHIQGRAAIDTAIGSMQGYLREEWRQAAAAKQAGAVPEDALKRIDLTAFSAAYGQGVAPSLAAVRRMYDIIDGRAGT